MINILFSGNSKVFDGALTELISITNRTKEPINCYIFTMDVSRIKPDYTSMRDDQIDFLNEIVKEKIQEFLGSKLVITDRLHGMIFAAITETPCIALSNYNHKVIGTYDWISYLPYISFADSIDDAIELIPKMLRIENAKFDNTPLIPYFNKLAEELKPYA